MADPVTYCSWFYSSFCVTQSEWATWTQAGLTFATFAIALVRQEYVSKKAANEKAEAEAKLTAEREAHSEAMKIAAARQFAQARQSEKLRARAVAISIKPQLSKFESALVGLSEGDVSDTPGEAFAFLADYLELRNRPIDALDLLQASDNVLATVHYANTIYTYLDARKSLSAFQTDDFAFLHKSAVEQLPFIKVAQEALDSLIFRKPAHPTADRAAA